MIMRRNKRGGRRVCAARGRITRLPAFSWPNLPSTTAGASRRRNLRNKSSMFFRAFPTTARSVSSGVAPRPPPANADGPRPPPAPVRSGTRGVEDRVPRTSRASRWEPPATPELTLAA
ncbi:hypothetical protein F2P81_019660 [Scophthalmus maximus]|uniref:Uncharacterized protein n=1 Tax=Scophthalmus maximus TaxID=52904 RepID=A0A6A4S2K1_SCOMX|nr:hypothetical protein F2P81_019660 [Scophthalmus maximus]